MFVFQIILYLKIIPYRRAIYATHALKLLLNCFRLHSEVQPIDSSRRMPINSKCKIFLQKVILYINIPLENWLKFVLWRVQKYYNFPV